MKKVVYISLALLTFLFASAEKSFACSCVANAESQTKQIQDAFAGSDAIFSGEVVEIKESPTNKYDFIVRFKVAKFWKGKSSREMTITTARDSAMCGYNFEIGKIYLVYASGKSENFSTTNCSRTNLFNPKDDAKYLDKLKRKKKTSA